MESIADILGGKRVDEPPEVQIIKRFVREKFHADTQVTIQQRQIIVGVKGAALASALRQSLHVLQKLCKTDKRLLIRIQ
jgi:uncharacterized protein YhjY with autotransporter beta-barrel domain